MFGRIARGALLGTILVLSVGVWPAGADLASVAVTSPANDSVQRGTYDDEGTPSGFTVSVRAQANTDCNSFEYETIRVEDFESGFVYSTTLTDTDTDSDVKRYRGSASWNTQSVRNGVYRIYLYVKETCTIGGDQETWVLSVLKVANPAKKPAWTADPAPASGQAKVTLKWAKNTEADVLEYRVTRTGLDGTVTFAVDAADPDLDGCSLSGNTYTCNDTLFPAQGWGGDYTYQVAAMRYAPSGTTTEKCTAAQKPCVGSAGSDVQPASLNEPTPEPTPSGSPSTTPKPSTRPSGRSTQGPRVLSFNSGGSSADFYTGTYSTSLPYEPKTLLVPGGRRPVGSASAQGYAGESLSETPPNYRTLMLPVAGGLLAFLSAAHVRRLLTRI